MPYYSYIAGKTETPNTKSESLLVEGLHPAVEASRTQQGIVEDVRP